jgi:hypothetical protein
MDKEKQCVAFSLVVTIFVVTLIIKPLSIAVVCLGRNLQHTAFGHRAGRFSVYGGKTDGHPVGYTAVLIYEEFFYREVE